MPPDFFWGGAKVFNWAYMEFRAARDVVRFSGCCFISVHLLQSLTPDFLPLFPAHWYQPAIYYYCRANVLWTMPDEELDIICNSICPCLVRSCKQECKDSVHELRRRVVTNTNCTSCFIAISICVEPSQTGSMHPSLCQTLLTARSVHSVWASLMGIHVSLRSPSLTSSQVN